MIEGRLRKIVEIDEYAVWIYVRRGHNRCNNIIGFILDGSKSGNRDHRTSANKAIFRHVCNFIYKTKRFTQNTNK